MYADFASLPGRGKPRPYICGIDTFLGIILSIAAGPIASMKPTGPQPSPPVGERVVIPQSRESRVRGFSQLLSKHHAISQPSIASIWREPFSPFSLFPHFALSG